MMTTFFPLELAILLQAKHLDHNRIFLKFEIDKHAAMESEWERGAILGI